MWSESKMHLPPPEWRKGELLNVRKYTDGQFRITRLGDEFDASKLNGIILNSDDCQCFISDWYAPSQVREAEYVRRISG